MKATQHTPGPWIIDGGAWTPPTQHMIRAKAAQCDAWIPVAHCYEPEAAANVRLIAAAPELLAALESISSRMEAAHHCVPSKHDPLQCNACVARAAIARATGGAK